MFINCWEDGHKGSVPFASVALVEVSSGGKEKVHPSLANKGEMKGEEHSCWVTNCTSFDFRSMSK